MRFKIYSILADNNSTISRRSFFIATTSVAVGLAGSFLYRENKNKYTNSDLDRPRKDQNKEAKGVAAAVKIQLLDDEQYPHSFVKYSQKATFKSIEHALQSIKNPNLNYQLVTI